MAQTDHLFKKGDCRTLACAVRGFTSEGERQDAVYFPPSREMVSMERKNRAKYLEAGQAATQSGMRKTSMQRSKRESAPKTSVLIESYKLKLCK